MSAFRVAVLLAVAAVAVAAVAATDYGTMYDDGLLKQTGQQNERVILYNLRNVFFPKLTPTERERLRVLSIEFPLRGPHGQPFEFYADSSGRVSMPLMSIRFLRDLCLAYVWLDTNGYTMESVVDYVSMLKYQPQSHVDFGGRYPDPIRALQIPANATDNSRVRNAYQNILSESLAFLLLHEVGHVLYRHPGYGDRITPADARQHRQNEDEADRFALEVLRRVAQPVEGVSFFFLSAAHFVPHRHDFASDADYEKELVQQTHPLTSERVKRVAEYMRQYAADYARGQDNPARATVRMRGTADAIDRQVVPVLADPEQHRLMAMRGWSMTLAGLAPRRPGELLAAPPPTSGARSPSFHGVFDGEMDDGTARLPVRALFSRRGDRVEGRYSFGAAEGKVIGFVEGDTLTFKWDTEISSGRGVLRSSPDGSRFQGTWGNGDRTDDGGRWKAARRRE